MRSLLPRLTMSTLLAGALLATGLHTAPATADGDRGRAGRGWVGTWATAPTAVLESQVTTFEDQTLRQVVHVSTGGSAVRVRLSNEFGDSPLVIGEAHIARGASAAPEQITEGSDRRLTFGGRGSVTVPPGERVVSDPVRLRVPALSELAISVYLPRRTEASTVHGLAFQRNVVAAGNVTAETKVEASSSFESWYFLSGVSVAAEGRAASSIVAFGDSITDGAITETNANHRWPDHLARRLHAAGKRDLGVLNAGIGGNRLLHDPKPPPGTDIEELPFLPTFGEAGIRRFHRDALTRPGAKYVVVLLGVNDLGQPGPFAPPDEEVTAAQLIDGYRKLIADAHRHGLKIYGGTITPFGGDTLGFYTPERALKRQAVNRWIRTSGAFDGVIDFDAAVRDPADPERLLAAYDSGDHLHPNDAGMVAMAGAVPLRLLR